jgi:hypothetical protein
MEAEIASGMSAEEAAGRHKMRTENLIEEAIQGGFTEQQVRDLIGTYGDVPPDVITRAQFQAIQAKLDAKDLTGAALIYDAMTPEAQARFETSAAAADVQAIQNELNRLDGRQITANVRIRKLVEQIPIFGLATGGPMNAGQPYIVGEEGPELVVPGRAGTVIPAGKTRQMLAAAAVDAGGSSVAPGSPGSGGTTVEVHFHGPVAQDAERWVVAAVESAVTKGVRMPALRRSLG